MTAEENDKEIDPTAEENAEAETDAPEEDAVDDAGEKDPSEEDVSEDAASQDADPHDAAHEDSAPEDSAPEDAAPEDADPQDAAPEDAEEDWEAKVADLNDKLLRALAETENIRRRAERDKEDATKYAITNFARDMLTVSDNLNRAMDSVDPEVRQNNAAVEQIMAGLEMTAREVKATFERFGIETIEAMGEKFDHNLHEAMFEMDDASKPAGTVVQVVETGYVLKDRLLRPAKVGVSKGGAKDTTVQEPETQAAKDSQTAYEDKGEEPGAQLDEEL